MFCNRLLSLWLALGLLVASGNAAIAQGNKGKLDFGGLGLPDLGAPASDNPATLSASFSMSPDGKSGTVSVTAEIADSFHLYSVTQPPGGPLKTTIKSKTPSIKLGAFTSDAPPHIKHHEVYPGVPLEEHEVKVVWTAQFTVTGDFDPAKGTIALSFDGLACTDGGQCIPVEEELVATLGSDSQAPPAPGAQPSTSSQSPAPEPQPYRDEDADAILTAWIEPAAVKPGGTAKLIVNLVTDDHYHVYPFFADDSKVSNVTLIVPMDKGKLLFGLPTTSTPTKKNKDFPDVLEHVGPVTWTIPIRVPSDATEGEHKIEFGIGYQTCDEKSCKPPTAAILSGVLNVGASGGAPRALMTAAKAKPLAIRSLEKKGSWQDFTAEQVSPSTGENRGGSNAFAQSGNGEDEPQKSQVTIVSLCLALLGGVILNFMPCVLPVIGLKIMGFVEQSGSSRGEIVKLNLAYVLGILAVMWSLAGITVMFGNAFGWGEQFTYLEFKVFLAVLVLAMALSFLGVWEIPIPGFATSYKSNKLMEKEGVVGAFAKGLLTTVLATPCSGPFLGVVFGLTLTLSSSGVFLVYTFVGLGMGLPFLLLCIWPDVVRILPKPGAWMETLKEVLAFPLLVTVVYLVGAVSADYRIAMLSTLIGVWFACWLIGKVPAYESFTKKSSAWGIGVSAAVLWGVTSFYTVGPIDSKLPWQPFTPTGLQALRASGKTVMVDFTANWCVNCQVNTRIAIDRPGVAQIVKENNVAPLLADWTDRSDEIRQELKKLNSKQIPLLAIFPADPNAEPIILRDLISEKMVIDALKEAGPSRTPGRMATTSNPADVH